MHRRTPYGAGQPRVHVPLGESRPQHHSHLGLCSAQTCPTGAYSMRSGAIAGRKRPSTAQGSHMFMCPSVKANHSITATWCLPSMDPHYRTKPEDYVSHLVGHEGSGSLLAALKELGCAFSIHLRDQQGGVTGTMRSGVTGPWHLQESQGPMEEGPQGLRLACCRPKEQRQPACCAEGARVRLGPVLTCTAPSAGADCAARP